MSDFWDNFWDGLNQSVDENKKIGADVYLKKLAAKIQARNQDKQNLWESIQADNKKKADAEEWDRRNRITTETNQRWAQTQAERTANEQFDAVNYLIDAKGYRDKIGEFPKTTAGVKAAEARMKELDDAAKPKDKETFNADETLYRLLGPEKWLEYKTKSSPDGMPEARKPEQARIMAEGIVKKEVGTLPKEIDALAEASAYDNTVVPRLQSKQSELDAIEANRPGGIPALTDSLRLGQGQYATPEQQNAQVSPEQAASVTQELATLKLQLAELLKSLGAKQ